MENVYGTKKYFQSLGTAESDYYRNSTTRAVTNYSSYQNTLGRSSTGPYSHLNKFPYHSDMSLTSQYGYTSSNHILGNGSGGGGGGGMASNSNNGNNNNQLWGLWKDSRNLTPTLSYNSSSKTNNKKSVKSFTILLMTAAFIVMLAVLSVAGLAFYFSTFKSDLNDSMMVFDGKFMISRGDVFTTGLKYNHTSVFQQKAEFYERIIIKSMQNNGLDVVKCEIFGFGDGPLINVIFRLYLDMRKIPMTIKSVEEHIKESILKEIISPKSLLKGIKIALDSMEIKRLLNSEALKSASFIRQGSQSMTQSSSTSFDNHPIRQLHKPNGTKLISSPAKFHPKIPKSKLDDDIDIENAPVILGSFEVTKTDADLTHKKSLSPISSTVAVATVPKATTTKTTTTMTTIGKTSPSESVKSSAGLFTSTIGPISSIPNNGMKIKTKKITIEKVKLPSAITPINRAKIETITEHTRKTTLPTKITNMETTTKFEVFKNATTGATLRVTVDTKPTLATQQNTTKSAVLTTLPTTKTTPQIILNTQNPPKLDEHLFTNAPVMDHEPWLPIQPSTVHHKSITTIKPPQTTKIISKPLSTQMTQQTTKKYITDKYSPFGYEIVPKSKHNFAASPSSSLPSTNPNSNNQKDLIYLSFSNPAFTYAPPEIERLGTSDVRPYPIPVNKINEESTTILSIINNADNNQSSENKNVKINYDEITMNNGNYEHLGGGIIVKKSEKKPEIAIAKHKLKLSVTESSEIFSDDDDETTSSSISTTSNTSSNDYNDDDVAAIKFGDLLLELLENDKKNHSLTTEYPKTKQNKTEINFANIKDFILATSKNTTENNTSTTNNNNNNPSTPRTINYNISTTITQKPLLSTSSSYVEVETVQYTPPSDSWDQGLFPVQLKPEFSTINNNGTTKPSVDKQIIRKIFNETLQAWIVENSQKLKINEPPKNSIKRNGTIINVQNITAIFDNLASKLAMSPTFTTKLPSYLTTANILKPSGIIQNYSSKTTNFIRPTIESRNNDKLLTNKDEDDDDDSEQVVPILLPTSTTEMVLSKPSSSSSSINSVIDTELGEAEIEEVDPTQYEEILKLETNRFGHHQQQQSILPTTETTPAALITLMPAKSNSGLRPIILPAVNNPDDISRGFRTQESIKIPEASIIRTEINLKE